MILTCPQCGSRYLLPADQLGAEGHNVKCTSCSDVWFQMPDPEELAQLTRKKKTAAPDDFPEMLKKAIDDNQSSEMVDDDEFEARLAKRRKMAGYAAAALAFLLIMGVLVLLQGALSALWMPAHGLYKTLGVEAEMELPGKGLVFDRMRAVFVDGESGGTLKISGQLINLTSQPQEIPLVRVGVRDSEANILETWLLDLPETTMEAEQVLDFEYVQEVVALDAYDVHISFSLTDMAEAQEKAADLMDTHEEGALDDHATDGHESNDHSEAAPKTDAAGAESNPAPHAADSSHSSGDEEASESPAPVSAPHH